MRRAGIVVVPSRWREPFGLVALQGAAAARPVVAFATGGLAEIVVDGETGMLVALERGSDGTRRRDCDVVARSRARRRDGTRRA